MLATESFFKADKVRQSFFSRKERKEMKGGNGVRAANVVTLCMMRTKPIDAAENHTGSRTSVRRRNLTRSPRSSQRNFSHKEHKEHKETIDGACGEASKNLENASIAPTHWIAAVSAAKENI